MRGVVPCVSMLATTMRLVVGQHDEAFGSAVLGSVAHIVIGGSGDGVDVERASERVRGQLLVDALYIDDVRVVLQHRG